MLEGILERIQFTIRHSKTPTCFAPFCDSIFDFT